LNAVSICTVGIKCNLQVEQDYLKRSIFFIYEKNHQIVE
jgi:hypothetical protein